MEATSYNRVSDADQSGWSCSATVERQPSMVKEEPAWGECGVSEAAAAEGLYAEHEVKDELVIGPELIQQQDIAFSVHNELATNEKIPLEPVTGGADAPPGCSHACPGDGPRCNRSTEQQHGLRSCFVRLERLPVGDLHSSTPFRATHLVKKQYSCDIKTNLTRHELIRTGEKPFNCVVCHKHFRKKSRLLNHLRVHTGEKPFGCDVCGRRFRDRACIIRHLRCHTGEKPYDCDVCNKPFRERGTLKKHLRVHTGERPFACDVCGKRFAQRTSLVFHSRYHESKNLYIWDVCKEKFIKKSTLTKHVQSPVGKDLYSCDVCNKRFITEMFLTRHKNIHTSVL